MSIDQTFDFDLPVAGALQASIVVAQRYGLKEVPLVIFLHNLLSDPEALTQEIFEIADIDHQRVLNTLTQEVEKRYPQVIDWEIRP
ncbi:hypothetical protein EVA_19565, partial [gut metagenome]